MKTLLLLRHAKSSWQDEGQADYDRPLNGRGRRDAPRMGTLLRDEQIVPDRILCSTARRAQATAEQVALSSGYTDAVDLRSELYLAVSAEYLQVLRQLPDDCSSVLVVGHNPGLENLLGQLTGCHEAMPTAALARIELPIDRWSDLDSHTRGELSAMWRPKELPR